MSGQICPVCQKKIYETTGLSFADHVEACASRITHCCPACGSPLTRVHKAEERITTVECLAAECEFQLELWPGGKVA